ncbi:uncharacterized protein LOC124200298 isoform X2 [Daphnia pulex]|uniref:uncharacterized protein LOC124200298 isoform X2 n=1 Tax=Daphnia pulex TaxID=6669 RepID=UPI001EDECF30|nr:uncharacterized protein LOC124200298 isoform X2 [Daphnia pulex]
MWKVIIGITTLLFLAESWLSIGIEGNPTMNWPISSTAGSRQLHRLSHRPLVVSDDELIYRQHQPRWHFHFHSERQQIPSPSINLSKIVKRSVDSLETDTLEERQSRGEPPTDDSQDKIAAVENEINQLAETVNSLAINQTESPLLMLPETTSNNETLAQFFGITNIYVGGQRLINKKQSELLPDSVAAIDCPVCPTVSAVECPTLPEHIILTVTACESFGSSLGTCSVASIASSGTIFILFPSSSAGSGGRKSFGRYLKKKNKNIAASVATAVVGVVAAAPNTKVKMTCPYIPTDVTVTTQNGPVLPYKPREEAGFIQLIVTGTLASEKYTMACVWASSP